MSVNSQLILLEAAERRQRSKAKSQQEKTDRADDGGKDWVVRVENSKKATRRRDGGVCVCKGSRKTALISLSTY